MPNIYNLDIFIMQSILIIIVIGIIIFILRFDYTARLERRFSKYSVNVINQEELSLFDKFKELYLEKRQKLTKLLYRIKIFDNYSKKYEKYCDNTRIIREDPMDYISNKMITGIVGIIIILLSDVLQYESVTSFQIILAFLVGFFVPDILLISRQKYRKMQIERDMLKAIIIMNNSFKSGLSIMQAIYIVSNELDGPISEEFKKMYIDLSFGLNMEVVFERFTKRVDTKEAKYITTSLNVLNKTGGNIVQVFASVERNSFTRKKLQEELGALAASSKAIYKILIVIPFILASLIFILNPSYFAPLFTTSIGIFLLIVIILIYVLYIIIIRKVVKVKVML